MSAPLSVPAPSLSLALHFGNNSAELRPESGRVLGQLVAALLSPELRSQRFVIEGHTDARGQPSANQRLSLERAEEVRQYLVALGVPAGRLRAVGRGAQELANPADPAAAENRRVRVVALP
jgi:outer membrane protein OmpA-like peptidoglycan-associated protein